MCIGTTVSNALRMVANLIDKSSCFESAAVSQVGFNDDPMRQRQSFEGMFVPNGFHCGKTKLMFHEHKPGAVVNKDASALESVGRRFSVGIKGAT